ncbi:hypothetical protein [Polyangium aurulentum]|uniref:hypothetical protein n=1 Tax=Polyangium aurulentum TaxID=2567896 RepID=UPI0010AE8B0A|nr:hypothetical protein [Polyangium aurulentum]UQA54811.1 hypothetical protein E8A73_025935 [Polyangium aurulentum]
MTAKRMLVAGIVALAMSVPLAGYAASAPGQAADSETAASDESWETTTSDQSAQFAKALRDPDTLFVRDPDDLWVDAGAPTADFAQGPTLENGGVMAADAPRVDVEGLDSDPDVCLDERDQVIVVIQSDGSMRRLK